MSTVSPENFATVAGWTTSLPPRQFLLYFQPPPRPYSYWTQLRLDARHYKPWLFWVGGAGPIAFGAAWLLSHYPAPDLWWAAPWIALANILVGAQIFLSWLRRFVTAVRWTRTEPLNVGVVRAVKANPVWGDLFFADAIQADGTVVKLVNLGPGFVDDFLNRHGDCEVLFLKRPWAWSREETGFGIAARPVTAGTPGATEPVLHWTCLSQAKRLELEEIARRVDYPIDAVFFVVSAVSAANRDWDAAPGRLGHDIRPVTAQELCGFIPKHAASMFGNPLRASRILAGWGLRTGEDIGAIVAGCLAAGWLKDEPGDSPDDFRGIELPGTPARNGPWRRSSVRARPGYRRPERRPSVSRLLLVALLRIFGGFLVGAAITPVYVWWAERLNPEERPLVGRWYALAEKAGTPFRLLEFGSDRTLRLLRQGQVGAPAVGSATLWWVAHDGRIMIGPPLRGYRDHITRALDWGAHGRKELGTFRIPDADTLEATIGGRSVVFRRVAAGLGSDGDMFPVGAVDARP